MVTNSRNLSLGRQLTLLTVGTIGAGVLNYLSLIVFARALPQASFGDLNALLAILLIVVVPTGAAQARIAERIAGMASQGNSKAVDFASKKYLAQMAVIALLATLVYLLFLPVLMPLLDLRSWGAAVSLAPLVGVSCMLPAIFGLLQGLDRYAAIGIAVVFIATSRIAIGLPWVHNGGGAGGPLLGQAFGSALVVVVLLTWLIFIKAPFTERGTGALKLGIRSIPNIGAASAGGAFLAFAFLTNADVVLAKMFLTPTAAGQYGVLATIGKAILFVPAVVSVAMIPHAARLQESGGNPAGSLRFSAAIVMVVTSLALPPAAFAPDLVINTLFGPGYQAASRGVLPIVVAGAFGAVLYLLLTYAVAFRNHRWMLTLVLACLLQIACIAAFHGSPVQIAFVQAAVLAAALIVNELFFYSLILSRRSVLGAETADKQR